MKGGNFHGKCICNITRKVLNPGNSIAFSLLPCINFLFFSSLLFLALHLFGDVRCHKDYFTTSCQSRLAFFPQVGSHQKIEISRLHTTAPPSFDKSNILFLFSGYITTCCKVFRLLLMVFKKTTQKSHLSADSKNFGILKHKRHLTISLNFNVFFNQIFLFLCRFG